MARNDAPVKNLVRCAAIVLLAAAGGRLHPRPGFPPLTAAERLSLRDAPGGSGEETVGGLPDSGDLISNMRQNRGAATAPAAPAPPAAAPAACGGAGVSPSPPENLSGRVGGREYPSVFQAWTPASPLTSGPDPRHDLAIFGTTMFLQWDTSCVRYPGLSTTFTAKSLAFGRARRAQILQKNPHAVLIMEVRYRDALPADLPPGPQWWTGAPGYKLKDGDQHFMVNYNNPDYQNVAALKCKAAVESGVFDGCFLDWWAESGYEHADRVELLKKIRGAIKNEGLIIVNSNDYELPASAPYINGLFMETPVRSDATADNWKTIANVLDWAESSLPSQPHINGLEIQDASRQDLPKMRLATTTGLVHSDGYVLFADPDGAATAEHGHDWYPFWNKTLGAPRGKGFLRGDGAWQREYKNGTVISNPMGNPRVTVAFPDGRTSAAHSGADSAGGAQTSFPVDGGDGDLFLYAR
jgi:hypothetical protein